MPLLRINAAETTAGPYAPVLHGTTAPVAPVLHDLARGTGPVVIMVHGYKFAPGSDRNCPHQHILALDPSSACWKAVSWPGGLGFGTGARDEELGEGQNEGQNEGPDEGQNEGLGIAFGWTGTGTIWQAYAQAERAGRALAQVIEQIHHAAPDRPIHAIAHSMGVRVVLAALPFLSPGALRRIVALGGAEFGGNVIQAMSTPAGHCAELINVTSRENDLFDALLEALVAPPHRGDGAMGACDVGLDNVVTLPLDAPATLQALALRGVCVAAPHARICHWTFYIRSGVFDLYIALLRDPDRFDLDLLRAMAVPPTRRWSRIFAPHPRSNALSPWQKAAS